MAMCLTICHKVANICKEEQIPQQQKDENSLQHKFQDESNSISKKDSREEIVKEREEAKGRILEEKSQISKDELEFMLSLPVERKIPKVYTCNSGAARRNGKVAQAFAIIG
jgi:hypothetical protein